MNAPLAHGSRRRCRPGSTTPATLGACSPTGECVTGRLPADHLLAVDLGDVPTAVANLTVVDAASAGYVSAGACDVARRRGAVLERELPGHARVGEPVRRHRRLDGPDVRVQPQRRPRDRRPRRHARPYRRVRLELTAPKRVIDTRSGARVPAMGVVRIPLARRRGGCRGERDDHGRQRALATRRSGRVRPWRRTSSPPTSTVNDGRDPTVANMAFVEADGAGEVCVFTYAAAHVIVDVQSELVTEH